METRRIAIPAVKVLETPSQKHLRAVSQWLANHSHQNPALEVELASLLRDQIVPHDRGGLVAIAHTATTSDSLKLQDIRGVVMIKPRKTNILIESSDPPTAEALFQVVKSHACPQRMLTSAQTKAWIYPLLQQHYQMEREYDQQVLICTHPVGQGQGRWAIPQDKPALQRYAAAYLEERGTGSLEHPWDDWIQQRRVAVLEHRGEIVAVVRKAETICHAIVVAPFTFPPFRRQGFAQQLMAFFVEEMLQEYAAVKLWVDEDNEAALALYRSLGFELIGGCYTSYFHNDGSDALN